jgi:hypothetical protein
MAQSQEDIAMAQRLKRWESPRKEGRNDKGRGGSARQRQKAKQFRRLKQTLIEMGKAKDRAKEKRNAQGSQSKTSQPKNSPAKDRAPSYLDLTQHRPQQKGNKKGNKKGAVNCSFFIALFVIEIIGLFIFKSSVG